MTREQVLKHPAYWFEYEQNELYRQVIAYMERENINRTQLAERLKLSKGRVSQILNGQSNFSMKTLIELSLSIGLLPQIRYVAVDDVIKEDELKRDLKSNSVVTDPVLTGKKAAVSSESKQKTDSRGARSVIKKEQLVAK